MAGRSAEMMAEISASLTLKGSQRVVRWVHHLWMETHLAELRAHPTQTVNGLAGRLAAMMA